VGEQPVQAAVWGVALLVVQGGCAGDQLADSVAGDQDAAMLCLAPVVEGLIERAGAVC
jgi:hypothetical protein